MALSWSGRWNESGEISEREDGCEVGGVWSWGGAMPVKFEGCVIDFYRSFAVDALVGGGSGTRSGLGANLEGVGLVD